MTIYHIGQTVHGRITGVQPYGAFVSLDDQTQGLIHISECKSGVVHDLKSELRVGKEVSVTILDIEQYNKKISLSLRQEDIPKSNGPTKNVNYRKRFWTNNHLNIGFKPIEDQLEQWIEEGLKRTNK